MSGPGAVLILQADKLGLDLIVPLVPLFPAGPVQAARSHRSTQDRRPAAGDIPASVCLLVLFDLPHALLERAPDTLIRLRVPHVSIQLGEQRGSEEGVNVRTEFALDLGTGDSRDGQSVFGAVLHAAQNEIDTAPYRRAIVALDRSIARMDQSERGHGCIGYVVPVRLQTFRGAHIRS